LVVRLLTWYYDIGHNQRQLFSDKTDYGRYEKISPPG
jgi:hypothetical protein